MATCEHASILQVFATKIGAPVVVLCGLGHSGGYVVPAGCHLSEDSGNKLQY